MPKQNRLKKGFMQKESSNKHTPGKRALSPKMIFSGKINEKSKHFEVSSTKRIRSSNHRHGTSS